jgi:hypothetical protein
VLPRCGVRTLLSRAVDQSGLQGKRQAILVLGTHRNGTSAVAGALRLLGVVPPAHVLPPAADNPAGFWESPVVIGANDWILTSGGRPWFECLAFDSDGLDPDTRAAALTFIILSLRGEFGDKPLLLVKDPRICLLLDLWLPALQALQIHCAALLVLRQPGEAVASLAHRSWLPPAHGAALWLGYMLAAERATRVCRRCILTYDELLSDWRRALSRVGREVEIAWPVAVDGVVAPLEGFINPALRHHRGVRTRGLRMGRAPVGIWLEEAYDAMLGLGRDRTRVEPLARLDELSAAFSVWCRDEGQSLATSLPADHFIRGIPQFEVAAAWYRMVPRLTGGPGILRPAGPDVSTTIS